MRNKDVGLIAVLVVLLILLIAVWVVLFVAVQGNDDTKDEKDSNSNFRYSDDEKGEEFYFGDIDFEILRDDGDDDKQKGGGGGGSNNFCDDDQVILRLFREENTHAALWNETIYEEKVCYNEIFGEMYKGETHECTGDNLVLRLIKEFNSHVEAPNAFTHEEEYALDVCYGDLQCVTREDSCVGDEKEVVSLADYNNAHLEARNINNYELLVCCSSG